MDFTAVVSGRRSVRSFLPKKVEDGKLKMILASALSAPSAGNLQSYKVYLVRSEDARQELMIAAEGSEFIADAPISLVFCAEVTRSGAQYGERGEELYSYQDATIACAYAQLAAMNEGLSSCWIGGFEPLEVARIVGAEAYEVPVAILPIGYGAGKPEHLERRPIDEIVKEV